MQVADSVRYREAVTRLKRLLYDQPGWESVPEPPTTCPHPQQASHTHAAHTNHHLPYQPTVRWDGGGVGGVSTQVGREEAASRWLLELLRHQEDLITQLERENDFLKREVVSVGEGVRRMGQDNQELNRRLADALSQAIAMGEASEATSSSSSSTESGQKDATNSRIATLTREKATLQEEVRRLQHSLSVMTQREQEALTKLRQALTLAQDTHTHTAQVRASSESALEELSTLLAATKQEGQELRRLLEEADNKQKRKQEQKDEQVARQQQRIKALQEEREEQEQAISGLRQEVRESSRKVTALEEDLLAARAARTRLEVQLEEQRQHSRDAHARLDQIIVARSGEAAAGTARAQELEDRLTAAREDTSRLLLAITTLAQGSGRGVEADTTDDVKSERLAAGQQLGAAITAIQARHESEVRSLRDAAQQQSEAMDRLREEVASMRQQLASDNESYRTRLEEVGRGLAVVLTTTTAAAAAASSRSQDSLQAPGRMSTYDSGLPTTPAAPDDPIPAAPDCTTPTAPDDPTPAAPEAPDCTTPAAPDDPTPAAPDDATPAAPDDPTPAAPDDPTAAAPDDPTAAAPDDPTSATPDDPTPAAPNDPTPTAPDDPTPAAPDDPTATAPDNATPAAPDDPTPAAPDDPTPAAPDATDANASNTTVHHTPAPIPNTLTNSDVAETEETNDQQGLTTDPKEIMEVQQVDIKNKNGERSTSSDEKRERTDRQAKSVGKNGEMEDRTEGAVNNVGHSNNKETDQTGQSNNTEVELQVNKTEETEGSMNTTEEKDECTNANEGDKETSMKEEETPATGVPTSTQDECGSGQEDGEGITEDPQQREADGAKVDGLAGQEEEF
ncbi:adventurous-gliding motility protein Z [Procambarus clarkii]|uniref:adventurous-gliding motility protein Z n=1 Tax=Procambarus clarkii TaxID=6728 RepID=UPI0037439871